LKWEIFNNGACTVGFGADFAAGFHAGTDLFVPTAGINHVVSVVGFGYSSGRPYMVCKNSWGATWGDTGFFKMLATDEYFGTGAKSNLIRVHCPNIMSSGIGTTCKDGEMSSGMTYVAVQVNPASANREFSSVYGNDQNGFGCARSWLNSAQAWSARSADKAAGHYLIMDLGKEELIAGVATQGRADYNQWVTYYRVDVSNDKHTWTEVYVRRPRRATDGGEFYFKGNTDQNSYVTNMFGSPADYDVSTWKYRYVKITVMDFHNWPSMRAGVIIYRTRGCWCAGTYCPTGTVCSHEEGCVAPGDGSTTSIETFGHVSDDGADAGSAGTTGTVGETEPLGTSPSPNETDLWKTWGPVSVLANVLIIGILAGAACVYCACIRRGEKGSPVALIAQGGPARNDNRQALSMG